MLTEIRMRFLPGNIFKRVGLISIFVSLSIFIPISVNAGNEKYIDYRNGSQIAVDSVLLVSDPQEGLGNFSLYNNSINVFLRFDDSRRDYYDSTFFLKVRYQIKLYKPNGTYDKINDSLSIYFDAASSYRDIQVKQYPGYVKSEIKILSVALSSGLSSVPDDVFLELELVFDRFYTQYPTGAPSISVVSNGMVNNTLQVAWNYEQGHEYYDLEWVFIDTSIYDPDDYTYSFKNATRINTTHNHYDISLAYPPGILIFRVRYVSIKVYPSTVQHPKIGPWSIVTDEGNVSNISSTYKFGVSGIERKLNWQYSATYAEGGKRKEIINFHDGLYYLRQQVTIVNTDSNAIVQETMYDHSGRTAVQILPAPTKGQGIQFYHNGDTSEMYNGIFDKHFFDTDSTIYNPLPLDDSSNRSITDFYYSSANGYGIEKGQAGYISDGNGYPYMQTQYLTDGTNRISMQSGYGSDHKIGSGRETKYFYGTPTCQEELDRLFGNEVGCMSHYKKNMVLDPNGQVSISYLDMQDRVIATAIAGKASNLLMCDDIGDIDTIDGNIDCSQPPDINNEKTTTTNIQITAPGNQYYFTYDLGNLFLCDTCFICKDCWYYLSIRVKNMQNQQVIYFIDTITKQAHIEFSTMFQDVGTYQITKKLVLFHDSAASYIQQYEQQQSCVTLPEIEPDECYYDCEGYCFSVYAHIEYGDTIYYDRVSDTVLSEEDAWNKIDSCRLLNCNEMSDNRTECQIKEEIMLNDVSPGGQYFDNFPGKYLTDNNGIEYPNPLYGSLQNDWLDSLSIDGIIDAADFSLNFSPPVYIANQYSLQNYDTCWNWVRENWDDQWAIYMFQFHPEYCIYDLFCQCCPKNPSFVLGNHHVYDSLMMFTQDYDVVQQYYLFNPLGIMPDTNSSNYWISQQDTIGYMPHPLPTGDSLLDPLFVDWRFYSCFSTICLSENARGAIMDSLLHFLPLPDTSAWASVWFLLDDPANIADSSDSSILGKPLVDLFRIVQDSLLPNLDSLTGNREMSKFLIFRGIYHFYKQKLFSYLIDSCRGISHSSCSYLASDTTKNGQLVDLNGFAIRWVRNPIFDFLDHPYLQDTIEEMTIQNCYIVCEDNADRWMLQLQSYISEYQLDSVTQVSLREDLISLCQDSCSLENTSGMLDSARMAGILNGYCSGCNDFPRIQQPEPAYSAAWCSCNNWENMLGVMNLSIYSDSLVIQDSVQKIYGYLYPADTIALWNHTCAGIPDYSDIIELNFPDYLFCDSNAFNAFPEYSSYLDSLIAECERMAQESADALAQNIFHSVLSDSLTAYSVFINSNCMNNAVENFEVKYLPGEFMYTLYYYDQAGNLIKTIPPEGVIPITDSIILDSIAYYRQHGTGYIHPSHGLISGYKFNSLQASIKQGTPDADTSKTWYDLLGRIAVSQTAHQNSKDAYSYTLYDGLGRIVEVGEISDVPFEMNQDSAYNTASLSSWITSGTKNQITRTYYDNPLKFLIPVRIQKNLRNRVAAVSYCEDDYGYDTIYDAAIHYSYDVHGNVDVMVQDIPHLTWHNRRYVKTQYLYDLVSGKVNTVVYQGGQKDCFIHRYEYDADNRITNVFVSRDGLIWERDAKYFYYPHAPLSRIEIGDRQVQAADYYYTIQGWIKGVNSNTLYAQRDPGKDAIYDTLSGYYLNANFAQDAMGYSLNYYQNDYNPVQEFSQDSLPIAIPDPSTYTSLYNGNISAMVTQFLYPDTNSRHLPDTLQMMLKSYRYDCANRLKMAYSFEDPAVQDSNKWASPSLSSAYYEGYSYDQNGNIMQLLRYNKSGNYPVEMDSLSYHYNFTSGMLDNNQLTRVSDRAPATRFAEDVDNQPANNYLYNANGSLIHDESGGLDTIKWTVYGKVKKIIPDTGMSTPKIEFRYDPMGNRQSKTVTPVGNFTPETEYYMRDAQGNVLAMYSLAYNATQQRYELYNTESHIYGSSRIGLEKRKDIVGIYVGTMQAEMNSAELSAAQQNNIDTVINYLSNIIIGSFQSATEDTSILFIDMDSVNRIIARYGENHSRPIDTVDGDIWIGIDSSFISPGDILNRIPDGYGTYVRKKTRERVLGDKQFELTNHLGNVISTVSDRKLGVEDPDSAMYVQYYAPLVVTAQDYYSFGMQMPGRSFTIGDTIAQRTDTLPDQPCDDHFALGTTGWNAYGSTGNVQWNAENERMYLYTQDDWDDGAGKSVQVIQGKDYLFSANIVFDEDLAIYMAVYDLSNNLIASKWAYETDPMPVSLSFNSTDSICRIAFQKCTNPGNQAIFYIDDVLVAGDSIVDTNYVRVPMVLYQFGFNGKMNDNELYGNGNSLDFGARIYDSRVGRWLSVDKKYYNAPSWSPYNFSLNSPIFYSDPDGNWIEVKTTKFFQNKNGDLQIKKWYNIFQKATTVQKDIIIHNAKFYDSEKGTSNEVNAEIFAKAIERNILESYNSTDKKYGNRVLGRDEFGDPIYNERKTYISKVKFENDDGTAGIKVVEDLDDVKAKGPNPDNLFIHASYQTIENCTGKSGEGFGAIDSPFMFIKNAETSVHELFHNMGNFLHSQFDGLYFNNKARVKDIKNINQPSNAAYESNSEFIKLKKN